MAGVVAPFVKACPFGNIWQDYRGGVQGFVASFVKNADGSIMINSDKQLIFSLHGCIDDKNQQEATPLRQAFFENRVVLIAKNKMLERDHYILYFFRNQNFDFLGTIGITKVKVKITKSVLMTISPDKIQIMPLPRELETFFPVHHLATSHLADSEAKKKDEATAPLAAEKDVLKV